MSILPVAQRELRVAARQIRIHYARVLAALVAMVVVGYAWSHRLQFGMGGTGGRDLFVMMARLTAWVCLLGGVRITSDAISRERREGTLGFLFLSHLTGMDVVTGKLLAHATIAFYALLAIMPVLGLTLLEGGVPGGDFWFVMLGLVNTLFFSAALGLWVSSLSKEPRTATTTATMLALFFWLGLPSLAQIASARQSGQGGTVLVFVLNGLSPSTPLAMPAATALVWPKPWFALLGSQLLGWAFLAAAAACTRQVWRERPAGRTLSQFRQWWRDLALGSPARRTSRRKAALERNAFLWLLVRRRWKPLWPSLFVGGAIGLAVCIGGFAARDLALHDVLATFALPLCILLHLTIKFWVAGEVAAGITVLRRDGALEGLLTTPLSVSDILRAQWLAVWRQFGAALIGLLLLTLGSGMAFTVSAGIQEGSLAMLLAVASTLALAADVGTLIWLATWRGIAARKPHHAAGSAAFRVLVLPWILLVFLLPGIGRSGGPANLLVVWAFVGFGSDFIWWQWSRQELMARFRSEAARIVEAGRKDWLERLASR